MANVKQIAVNTIHNINNVWQYILKKYQNYYKLDDFSIAIRVTLLQSGINPYSPSSTNPSPYAIPIDDNKTQDTTPQTQSNTNDYSKNNTQYIMAKAQFDTLKETFKKFKFGGTNISSNSTRQQNSCCEKGVVFLVKNPAPPVLELLFV